MPQPASVPNTPSATSTTCPSACRPTTSSCDVYCGDLVEVPRDAKNREELADSLREEPQFADIKAQIEKDVDEARIEVESYALALVTYP